MKFDSFIEAQFPVSKISKESYKERMANNGQTLTGLGKWWGDEQITEWGIEHNEKGWRADAYLYCVEARDLHSGYIVPLAPSWVIGEKSRCVAKLVKNDAKKRYDLLIQSNVSDAEMAEAKENGTVKNSALVNPENKTETTPISTLRGDKHINGANVYGLRMWENHDLVPRPEDVFQEKLYCVRYVETYYERLQSTKGKKIWVEMSEAEVAATDLWLQIETGHVRKQTRKHYCTPSVSDLKKEQKTLELIKERFEDWQKKGFIPSMKIESGEKTDEPIRTRGWTFWHHLFTPRQLLVHGLLLKELLRIESREHKSLLLLGLGKVSNWSSRMSLWDSYPSSEKGTSTFTNQALNALFNFSLRPLLAIEPSWFFNIADNIVCNTSTIKVSDIKSIQDDNDFWITDPPYADAVNYHELSDFFLAWYEKQIPTLFPEWYSDSKKALAIKGSDENFRKGMVEAYSNLARHMPDNGAQVVMFTHQDAGVWADLALILWASGLQVSAAWTIATETDSALKSGNYVQGTVIMILRKQTSDEETFRSDIHPEVEDEVKLQMERMVALDGQEDKNFGDSDYQLAAYAAALRILTKYKKIHPIDVTYELNKPKRKNEKSEIEKIIENAVEIATNYLVPEDLGKDHWLKLSAEERFYLKGMEVETHGEYRNGVYQEFARGFGLKEYKHLLSTGKANETRIKTPSEFKNKELGDEGFGTTVIRKLLFAVYETLRIEDPSVGVQWLHDEIKDYWNQRKMLIELLTYVEKKGERIGGHWLKDVEGVRLLRGRLENDRL